jgi:kynurenine formamidase
MGYNYAVPDPPLAMFVDLSLPLTESLGGFPGYPGFESRQLQSYDQDGKVAHAVELTTHTGTHVDAPAHFLPDGATIDEVAVDVLVGRYRVADLRAHAGDAITAAVLAETLDDFEGGGVVLVTGDVDRHFDGDAFFERAAVLTADAAEWLVDRGVTAVANDFLTESIAGPERPVHTRLLGADVPIVEYLCHTDAVADRHAVWLSCLPLSMPGLEAAPARVVATDRPAGPDG